MCEAVRDSLKHFWWFRRARYSLGVFVVLVTVAEVAVVRTGFILFGGADERTPILRRE